MSDHEMMDRTNDESPLEQATRRMRDHWADANLSDRETMLAEVASAGHVAAYNRVMERLGAEAERST